MGRAGRKPRTRMWDYSRLFDVKWPRGSKTKIRLETFKIPTDGLPKIRLSLGSTTGDRYVHVVEKYPANFIKSQRLLEILANRKSGAEINLEPEEVKDWQTMNKGRGKRIFRPLAEDSDAVPKTESVGESLVILELGIVERMAAAVADFVAAQKKDSLNIEHHRELAESHVDWLIRTGVESYAEEADVSYWIVIEPLENGRKGAGSPWLTKVATHLWNRAWSELIFDTADFNIKNSELSRRAYFNLGEQTSFSWMDLWANVPGLYAMHELTHYKHAYDLRREHYGYRHREKIKLSPPVLMISLGSAFTFGEKLIESEHAKEPHFLDEVDAYLFQAVNAARLNSDTVIETLERTREFLLLDKDILNSAVSRLLNGKTEVEDVSEENTLLNRKVTLSDGTEIRFNRAQFNRGNENRSDDWSMQQQRVAEVFAERVKILEKQDVRVTEIRTAVSADSTAFELDTGKLKRERGLLIEDSVLAVAASTYRDAVARVFDLIVADNPADIELETVKSAKSALFSSALVFLKQLERTDPDQKMISHGMVTMLCTANYSHILDEWIKEGYRNPDVNSSIQRTIMGVDLLNLFAGRRPKKSWDFFGSELQRYLNYEQNSLLANSLGSEKPHQGYPGLVVVLLRNLINNSLKYSRAVEGVELKVEARLNGDELYYRDNGQGIAADKLPHIFEKGERAGRSDNKGHGFGLNIILKIVALYGGSIRVESKEGKFTEFRIKLPKPEGAAEKWPTVSSSEVQYSTQFFPGSGAVKHENERIVVSNDYIGLLERYLEANQQDADFFKRLNVLRGKVVTNRPDLVPNFDSILRFHELNITKTGAIYSPRALSPQMIDHARTLFSENNFYGVIILLGDLLARSTFQEEIFQCSEARWLLAESYRKLNMTNQACHHYNLMTPDRKLRETSLRVAGAYYKMAETKRRQGDYRKALNGYARARVIYERTVGPLEAKREIAQIHLNMVILFYEMGKHHWASAAKIARLVYEHGVEDLENRAEFENVVKLMEFH